MLKSDILRVFRRHGSFHWEGPTEITDGALVIEVMEVPGTPFLILGGRHHDGGVYWHANGGFDATRFTGVVCDRETAEEVVRVLYSSMRRTAVDGPPTFGPDVQITSEKSQSSRTD
jgi:hypothetical protein